MPFLLPRTASVLAVGFLLTGSSAPVVTSASADASCSIHWTENQFPVPPAGLDSQITSVAALSPTNVWMLITRTNKRGDATSAVYHLVGADRQESTGLADNERSFAAKWIVARSDTDVWVIGSAHGALQAWQYDGSSWTDHPPARYSRAGIDTAALDGNGTLYLAGNNRNTRTGIILSYGGSRWADLSPANPPYDYQALAVTAGGTLIAAGGGRDDGTLQERSGTTWTTVSLSVPVNTISRISVGRGGTLYGVGSAAGNQPVLIEQSPGSRSATVLATPPAGQAGPFTTGWATLGLDVWLLGEDEPREGWHHSWITHDDGGFAAAGRQISRPVTGSAASRSGQSCWPAAASRVGIALRSLPRSSWCARCGCDGLAAGRTARVSCQARPAGSRCRGLGPGRRSRAGSRRRNGPARGSRR